MKKLLLTLLLLTGALSTSAAPDPALVRQLAADDNTDKIEAIQQLAAAAEPGTAKLLQAMADGSLYVVDDALFVFDGDNTLDAFSGEVVELPDGADTIMVNNRLRGELANALAALKLFDSNREVRLTAARELQSNVGAELAPVLVKAKAAETDPAIRELLVTAHAKASLQDADPAVRLAAVDALASVKTPAVRGLLLPLTDPTIEANATVRDAAIQAMKSIERTLAWGDTLAGIFSGLSLGSILLLAALGLAITYGVMGIINMAHGELLMVGAYTAYVMQSLFRTHFPELIDWYLPAAIPVAFFTAAAVGVLMERTVIRWLYGRTLETLLATWGLSLILIQAARVIFGAQNVEVSNPSWMSGGVELLPNLILPWNRVIIIGFALFVLFLVWVLMNKTRLGMFVRAVTQNRPMAGCVGVPTSRIDTMAFALGAGIAGLGGVALSQISNVGPDMGQGYIVDSFMVVVVGGVGQLAGAVWAALGLGIFSKLLEGWAGAVIAKITILVAIIIFIQKRPQGIFALKGRFADQ